MVATTTTRGELVWNVRRGLTTTTARDTLPKSRSRRDTRGGGGGSGRLFILPMGEPTVRTTPPARIAADNAPFSGGGEQQWKREREREIGAFSRVRTRVVDWAGRLNYTAGPPPPRELERSRLKSSEI